LRDDNQRIEGWLQGTTLDLQSCNNLGGMPLYQNGEITPVASVDCASEVTDSVLSTIENAYGAYISDTGNWSPQEKTAFCRAVVNTGDALFQLANQVEGGIDFANAGEAFKKIMADDKRIKFENTNTSEFNCITNKNLQGDDSASINCGSGTVITEYTLTHELGHVFVGRTSANANDPNASNHPCFVSVNSAQVHNCMKNPILYDPQNPLTNVNNALGNQKKFIFGQRGYLYTKEDLSREFALNQAEIDTFPITEINNIKYYIIPFDWLRGDRGWGDSPVTNSSCGESVNSNNAPPPDFQQNACSTNQWLNNLRGLDSTGELEIIELEEAFADMFLNWVYRSLLRSTPEDSGFKNIGKGGLPDSISLELYETLTNGPGDDRFGWMTGLLIQLFSYYGW
jgi:hypothetical protein